MTDILHINTGMKRILILRDNEPEQFIQFNPSDVDFAEKFYQLIGEFEAKQTEYKKRFDEIEKDTEIDKHDIPVNLPNKFTLLRGVCEFIKDRIDNLFGVGTSKIVFGDALTLNMFSQFFEGVAPFIQTARAEKVAKYQHHNSSKVMK